MHMAMIGRPDARNHAECLTALVHRLNPVAVETHSPAELTGDWIFHFHVRSRLKARGRNAPASSPAVCVSEPTFPDWTLLSLTFKKRQHPRKLSSTSPTHTKLLQLTLASTIHGSLSSSSLFRSLHILTTNRHNSQDAAQEGRCSRRRRGRVCQGHQYVKIMSCLESYREQY